MDYLKLFDRYFNHKIYGRYITLNHIEPMIHAMESSFKIAIEGYSVLNKPIYSVLAGYGPIKIFVWSQMHGNESTTTKAIFDYLSFLDSTNPVAVALKQYFTFYILPMVNPDGAELYTRENANNVDLNRDADLLTQPESNILRNCFTNFIPDYAYNMHDQRTIFGAGNTGLPATISFLSPSYNEAREINDSRQKAINVISAMNDVLQQYIPGQVGRFDDSFNINCIGDTFQSLNVPTILFEAGHYPQDYQREITRKYMFIALLSGFNAIYENDIVVNKRSEYFDIPQNKINFYDLIYKNIKINYENKQIITNFASQYKEVVIENTVKFKAIIEYIGNTNHLHAHTEFECNGGSYKGLDGGNAPVIGETANFSILPGKQFINGLEIT